MKEEQPLRVEQCSCVDCWVTACRNGGRYPAWCPTAKMSEEEKAELYTFYEEPENRRIVNASNEARASMGKAGTRVEVLMEFARQMGAQKVGIATCISTLPEARVLAKILRRNGFEVWGAMCKMGSMAREQDLRRGVKMCNPIQQARFLNEMGTGLNVTVGLCVGHDSLFYRYSEAPVTTLVVKDWALDHNPIQALRDESIYSKL